MFAGLDVLDGSCLFMLLWGMMWVDDSGLVLCFGLWAGRCLV